jgi:DNA-binding response OmpR family regulator
MHKTDNKNILLVEDDLNLGIILKEYLEVKGYSVTHCLNGDEGIKVFDENKFNLCILDVMMPKKDGFTLAKEIREKDEITPIIFLTAKSMQSDKIEGFKLGADDYVTKPFSTEELLLRINAVLKRTTESGLAGTDIKEFNIGSYQFDSTRQLLIIKKEKQKLTSKENDLLKLLCIHHNAVLDRSLALREIWKDDNYFNSRSMDVYITKLRNYLKKDKSVEIVNVHGQGFKLIS